MSGQRELEQLRLRVTLLEKMVQQLLQPKSRARLLTTQSGLRLFRFTINESLADGTASSDILEMNGTDTGDDEVVNDPLNVFATLVTTNDPGYCLRQDGVFYAMQAPCPT